MYRGALGLVVGLVGLFIAPRAHAEEKWRLLYVREAGAENCPAEMPLRLSVTARLGYDPFSPTASSAVFARIGHSSEELEGSVELVDATGISRGRREMRSSAASCDEMARALALSISLAIDPENDAPDVMPTPLQPSAPAPAAAPLPPPPLPSPGKLDADRGGPTAQPLGASARLGHALALSALTVSGFAPAPAFGGGVSYRLRWSSWAVEAGGLAASSLDSDIDATTRMHTTLAAGELVGCFLYQALELCAVGMAGATWSSATGLEQPRTASGGLLAGGARVGLALALPGPFEALVRGGLLGVASPLRAEIDGVEVWRAPPFSATLALGARWRFP
jgi:hypothetical protein